MSQANEGACRVAPKCSKDKFPGLQLGFIRELQSISIRIWHKLIWENVNVHWKQIWYVWGRGINQPLGTQKSNSLIDVLKCFLWVFSNLVGISQFSHHGTQFPHTRGNGWLCSAKGNCPRALQLVCHLSNAIIKGLLTGFYSKLSISSTISSFPK